MSWNKMKRRAFLKALSTSIIAGGIVPAKVLAEIARKSPASSSDYK
jgi:hypothetical protein